MMNGYLLIGRIYQTVFEDSILNYNSTSLKIRLDLKSSEIKKLNKIRN